MRTAVEERHSGLFLSKELLVRLVGDLHDAMWQKLPPHLLQPIRSIFDAR